ncbi:MAG TPA: DUF6340 family protein [Bacteroidia bacterium]
MNKFLLLILTAVVFSSCRTNLLYISVQSPSPVTISNEVKRVGIINRSIPEDQRLNAIHQAISLENSEMIKEGSAQSLQGLKDALTSNGRFEFINILDTVKLTTPGGGIFPAPLTWDRIDAICTQNKLQALFSLEVFDVELKVQPRSIPTNVTNPMQVVNAVEQVNLNTIVKTGWRIYDPRIKKVLDEFPLSHSMSFQIGGNPLTTVENIAGRKEYVKQTANKAGHIYADRIIPHWFRANRDYFIRGGSYDFKVAKRRARAGNWDGAADLWKKNTTSPRRKTAGRATYNMAIINEINGNIDEAISWAQKSYEDYGIRLALNYIHILKTRRAQENLLDIQKTK